MPNMPQMEQALKGKSVPVTGPTQKKTGGAQAFPTSVRGTKSGEFERTCGGKTKLNSFGKK